MEKIKIPVKLEADLLISARFEIRFTEDTMLSNLMPAFAFGKSNSPNIKVERMPASDIPKQIRDSDPGLKYALLSKISYGEYEILTGDKVIAIACKTPYLGWTDFKPQILKFFEFAEDKKLLKNIDQFLISYVDFIGREYYESFNDAIDLSLLIQDENFSNHEMVFKLIIPEEVYKHTLHILSNADATDSETNSKKSGIVVDIATIYNNSPIIENYDEFLDQIHIMCKRKFFMCLTESVLKKFGPSYE